jgi:glycosyltransferase involved in cell wall biosynthesis
LAKALPATIDRSKVHIIPNGVDLDRFRPIDRELCLRELGWGADAFHIVSGAGDDPLTKRLELTRKAAASTRELGVCAEVHVLKGVPHENVPMYLNAGDVLLVTSVHEGSPNIVKEALACNLPIVSVDVGDVAERISGIEGCHIVPPDAAFIALKLQAVAVRRSRIEGRPRVQHLSLFSVAERLRAVYELLLKWAPAG